MKDKITEIISEHCIEFQICGDKECECNNYDYMENALAEKILSLFKNIQKENNGI